MFYWLNTKARVSQNGGASVVVPLMYGKNTTAKAYSAYGIIDTTPQEGITAAQYQWAQYADSISISGLEEMQNQGELAVIKLLEAKVKQAEMSLRDRLDIDLWATSQAANLGILNIPSVVDTTTTVGNISKSSNSWWQCQTVASGSFAARGLSDMRNLYNTIMNQSLDNSAPDFIISDQNSYQYYEGLLQPQARFTDMKLADGGFENLKYKAAAYTFDGNTPSGKLYMLRSENLNLVVHSKRNFVNSPFVKPSNQDAKVAQILWMGQVVSDNIRKLGSLTGITA